MRILNLHGFMGKADNRSYAALCGLMPKEDISSPQLHFMEEHPAELLDKLLDIAADNHVELVIGQSLGGAYALLIAMQLGVPCILTNPCLHPADTAVIAQSDLNRELLEEYRKMSFQRYFGKAYILVSDHDDIIPGNLEICKQVSPNVKQVSGTHSRIDNLQEELASILKQLEDPEARKVHMSDLIRSIDQIMIVDDARTFDITTLHEDEDDQT